MTQSSAPNALPSSPPSPPPPPIPSPRQAIVSGVLWQNVLEFTHLFRGFRLAINPAKLGIALLAILIIYVAGRLFDAAWGDQVYPDEIQAFSSEKPEIYLAMRASRRQTREFDLETMLDSVKSYDRSSADPSNALTDAQIDELKRSPESAFRTLRAAYERQFHDDLNSARDLRKAAETLDSGARTSIDRSDYKPPALAEQESRARAAARLLGRVTKARDTAGHRIFDTFLKYEITQFDLLVENTLSLVRMTPIRTQTDFGSANETIEGTAVSTGLLSKNPDRLWHSDTLLGCIANMAITGPSWLFTGTGPMQWQPATRGTWGASLKVLACRAGYLISLGLLALLSLLVMALAGASIARLSALELAGNERPPLKDVFAFAFQRWWVFVQAPITPFLILLVVGLALAAFGLLGAIPFIGEILLGMFFILFLAVGFVLMLLSLGIIGGFNLLYPTIAVEGADAFDAMSRSFAYVYARPWRVLCHTLVSLIYGVITFLFVSFAVYLILLITHTFVGWGTSFLGHNYGWYSGSLKLDTLWTAPRFGELIVPINWYAMNWSEYIGALFLHFWVYLLIATIGAYVISYYFSSHTIMYLLLRRSVDGQGIREVYMEDPPAPAPSVLAAPASTPVAASTIPNSLEEGVRG